MRKKQFFKALSEFIQLFDVFGVPISFNFDGQEIYKSVIGGLSTIIVTFLIVVSFQSQIKSFSDKETIYFDINSSFNSNPSPLLLNNENFMFAIKVEQSNEQIFNTRPYFNILLNQANYTTNNSITTRKLTQLDFQPCTIEQFSKFGNKIEEAFKINSLSEYICPTNETSIHLQGAFLNQDFNFAKIQVSTCKGFTNQSKWNVTCASQSEIDSYLTQNGQFRVALYSINYVVNPTVATGYSDIYLSEDLNFLFQPGYMKQIVNVYFKEYEVKTDESLFIDKDINTEKFIFRNEENEKLESVIDISNTNTNSSPLTIYFRSDFFAQSANRRFQKIDQLLAYFGGIFNIFLLVFGIFVKWYNITFYKLKMANRLYQYTDLNQSHISPDSYLNKQADIQKENIVQLEKQAHISRIEKLYNYFKNYIIKSEAIYPQFEYLVYLITCKKKYKTLRNQLVEKSIQQIEQDSNVRVLMKKLQEIEKIKLIFLDENQLKLFNFMQRPIISRNETPSGFTSSLKSNSELSKSAVKQKKLENFRELIQAYKVIHLEDKDIVSLRLLNSLSELMRQILDISLSKEKPEEIKNKNSLDPEFIKCQSFQQPSQP